MAHSFSFVLPAYKNQFLSQAINSILRQTYSDFELIIVNDASPYNLDTTVNGFKDKRITYYTNSNNLGKESVTKSWNHAITYASGDFIILASDDDYYHPNYLASMVNLLVKYPLVDLFHCRLRYIDSDGNFLFLSQPAAEFENCCDFISQRLIHNRKQAAPEFMFRRSALEKINGFVEFPIAWYSDDATWNALSKNGVAYTHQPLLDFRMSGINLSSSNVCVENKIDAIYEYKQWLGKFLNSLSPYTNDELRILELCKENYKAILNSQVLTHLCQLRGKSLYQRAAFALKNKDISYFAFFRIILESLFK